MSIALSKRISTFTAACCGIFIIIILSVLFAYQGVSLATKREAFAQNVESYTDVLKQVILSKKIFDKNTHSNEWLSYHNQLQLLLQSAPKMTPHQQVIINSIKSRNQNLKTLFAKQNQKSFVSADKLVKNHFDSRLLMQLESIRADAVHLSAIVQKNIRDTVEQEFMLVALVLLATLGFLTFGSMHLRKVVKTSLQEVELAIKNNNTDHFQRISLTYPSDEFESIVEHFQAMNGKLKDNSVSIEAMQQIIADRTKILEELTRTDPLTKVPNRRALFERGTLEYSREKRADQALSVILFDCDFFKKINDEYGHFCGDEMLKHISDIAKEEIRDIDFFGRYGGEEFVVILPNCSVDGGIETAKRIQEQLKKKPLIHLGKEVPVTISAGVSQLSNQHQNFEQMLHDADQAMYLAKEKGRNRIETLAQSSYH